jgi:hypothetical protein
MKRSKLIATACFTAVIALVMLVNARAQDTGAGVVEKAILTFSAPVELPDMTLPAGTYVFKRPDANNARVIQVFNEDETKIHGTFLTVPTTRMDLSNDNVVTFRETAAGATPALRYWYYPMRKTGHEFIYSKDQAMRIAARTGETVLSTEGPVDRDASSQGTVATDTTATQAGPDDAVADQSQAAMDQSQDASADTAQAQADVDQPAATVAQAEPQEQAPRQETIGTAGRADELPRTASPLALSGLIGLLSLLGAASLHRMR